jgi:hypothetical protein
MMGMWKKNSDGSGATHLFEEQGALEEVARLAGNGLRGIFQRKNKKHI